MGRRPKPPPVDYLADGGTWPEGPFTPDAPTYVAPLAELAVRLRAETTRRGWSQQALADHTGANLNTVNYVLLGKVIPDTATLALLETRLGVRLWPDVAPPPETGNRQ